MLKLEDVCKKASSNIAQNELAGRDGNYPIYGASGFIKNVDFYQQDKPYIAIVKDGAGVGRVMKLPAYSSVIGTMQYIIPNDNVDVSYLAYALEHMNLSKYYTGATIPHIYFKDYKNEILPDTPLETQREIAYNLDKVAETVDICRKIIEKLDVLVKAKYTEMFGDIIRNEKNWPYVLLSDVAEIKIGPFGSLLHKEDYVKNGHPIVNPSHIIDGKIVPDENLTISDEKFEELRAYELRRADVVLGRRGEMGRCAIVENNGMLCGTGSMIIRPNEKVIPYFLQAILSSDGYRKILENSAVGVTMPNLNVPIVSSISIPLFPYKLQRKYAAYLTFDGIAKSAVKKALERAETLKSALMQKYFG